MNNPRTTLLGLVGTLAHLGALLAGVGAWCGVNWCLKLALVGGTLGGIANGLGNLLSKDGGL